MPIAPGEQAAGSANITGTVSIAASDGTLAVYFSPANPSVQATFSPTSTLAVGAKDGTFFVAFSPANPSVNVGSPTITGITNSINVYLGATAGTLAVALKPGTLAVSLDPGYTLGNVGSLGTVTRVDRVMNVVDGTITVANTGFNVNNSPTITGITNTIRVGDIPGTTAVYFSPANPSVNIGTPTITGITNSIAVHVLSTGGTLQVKTDPSSVLSGITSSIAVTNQTPAGSSLSDQGFKADRVLIAGSHTAASLLISGQRVAGTNVPLIVNTDGAIKIYDIVQGTITITNTGFNVNNSPTVTANAGTGTFTIKTDPGYELGSIKGINSSINVYIGSTAGTMAVFSQASGTVSIKAADGTMAVYFSPSTPSVKQAKASTGTYNKVAINQGVRQVAASNSSRLSLSVVHTSSNTLYVGLSNAITSAITGTGFPLKANQVIVFDDYTGAVFATYEGGEDNVKYIEI